MVFRFLVNGFAIACLALQVSAQTTTRTTSTSSTPYWTATRPIVYSTSVSTTSFNYYTTTRFATYTYTRVSRSIKSGATPTKEPISTSSYVDYWDDVQINYVIYPLDAVAESDLVPTPTGSTTRAQRTMTEFYMPIVWTAPATCTTSFTISAMVSVSIPTEVVDQLKPTSTDVQTSNNYGYTAWAEETFSWYLTPSAAPFTTSDDFTYSYYIRHCRTPPSYRTRTSSTYRPTATSKSDSFGRYRDDCYWTYGTGSCSSLSIWIIVVATVIPGLFVLGFFESFFWFRRLMTGGGCLRFGTVCWVLISLWVLCFTRTQGRRSPEDRTALKAQWKSWSFGKKMKLWFKWGFRHKYPEELLGLYSRNTVGIVAPQKMPIGPGGIPPGTFFDPASGQYMVPQMTDKNGTVVVQQPLPAYAPGGQTPVPGQAPGHVSGYWVPVAPGQAPPPPPAQVPGQFMYFVPAVPLAQSPSPTPAEPALAAPGEAATAAPAPDVAASEVPTNAPNPASEGVAREAPVEAPTSSAPIAPGASAPVVTGSPASQAPSIPPVQITPPLPDDSTAYQATAAQNDAPAPQKPTEPKS